MAAKLAVGLSLILAGYLARAVPERIVSSVHSISGKERATEFVTVDGAHRLEIQREGSPTETIRGGREPLFIPADNGPASLLVFRIEDGPLRSVVVRYLSDQRQTEYSGALGYVEGISSLAIPTPAGLVGINPRTRETALLPLDARMISRDFATYQKDGKWVLHRLDWAESGGKSETPFLSATWDGWITATHLNGAQLDLPDGFSVDPMVPLRKVGERTMFGIQRIVSAGAIHHMATDEPNYPWRERAERYLMLSDGFQIENGPWRDPQLGKNFAVLEEALERPWPNGNYRRKFWRVDLQTHDYVDLGLEGVSAATTFDDAALMRTLTGFARVNLSTGERVSWPSAGDPRMRFVSNHRDVFAVGRDEVVRLTESPVRLTQPGQAIRFSALPGPGEYDFDQSVYFRAERSVGGQVGLAWWDGHALHLGDLSATIVARRSRTGTDFLRQDFNSPPAVVESPAAKAPVLVTSNRDAADAADPTVRRSFLTTKVGAQTVAATLLSPDDVDEERPLVIHIYDRQAGRGFEFTPVDANDPYSARNWLAQGYRVLLPDLAFEVGQPGPSVVRSLRAWIAEVRKSTKVGRIAVVGHSWGGYGALFAATQMPELRCVIAGSPITDLTSLYFSSYAGQESNAPIVQIEQGRMGVSPDQNPAAYRANSPLTFIKNLKVPVLAVFGDRDELVNPTQHEILTHALWLAAKPSLVIRYANEGHEIGSPVNRRDFATQQAAWLRKHLLGERY
ncbi:MAG: prolyl oligopeptidase family serine peptidase [Chthonomonas sp.]|nr:prolyl oligopeptidase family serine peptidase [Chthonomonas sp.]